MNEIQLVVAPQIKHRLQELGAGVTARLAELNVDSLVATEGTLKDLKKLRADLNKELKDYEEQRKFVKNGVLNPYNEFEGIYKTEISDKYRQADCVLKDKIEAVESRIKDEKKKKIQEFFAELCAAEQIDFVKFESLNLEINLSTTEKAYREKCEEIISKIKDDLNLIHNSDYEAETLTEYKRTLNVSQAITTVKTRKENERLEAERIRQAEINRRIFEVTKNGLKYDEFSKTYLYNNEIYITKSSLEDLPKDEFSKKLIECQEKIKIQKQAEVAQKLAETAYTEAKAPVQPQMNFSAPEVLKAPEVKETPELVTATFEVTGTMAQLMSLGQYMRANQITYKNID